MCLRKVCMYFSQKRVAIDDDDDEGNNFLVIFEGPGEEMTFFSSSLFSVCHATSSILI